MTQNVGELQIPRGYETIRPLPLDPEIMGGIAIIGALQDDAVEQIALHLQQSFDVMRTKAVHPANANRTKEMGQCIAYSTIELGMADVEIIDQYAKEISRQQNHGMKTSDARPREITPNITQLWLGSDADSKHVFKLVRSMATLVLSDGSRIPNSSIWGLKAAPITKGSWGWM